MTPSKFMWVVIAGRGHSSEQLGRGFTVDLDEAKAKVDEHAAQLRRQGRTDWIGFVLDFDRPKLESPNVPILGWEQVYIVRRARLIDCEEDRVLRAVLVGMLREADRYDSQRLASPRVRSGNETDWPSPRSPAGSFSSPAA